VSLVRASSPGSPGKTWTSEERAVFVRRAGIDENGTLGQGCPKTRKSERLLAVPPDVIDALRRRRVQWEQERIQAGAAWQDLDLVFCTKTGGFIDRANLRHHFERLGSRAGIEGLTPYLLRHSATSILAEEGVPPERLSRTLGGTDTRIVEQHHRHRITQAIDVDGWRRLRGPVEGARGEAVPGGGPSQPPTHAPDHPRPRRP